MSFEFQEAVRAQVKEAHNLLNKAERYECLEDVEEAFEVFDGITSELEAAIADAKNAREELESRAGEVREILGGNEEEEEEGEDYYGDGPLEYLKLEEAYENAACAGDEEFEDMTADEVL